MGNKTKNTSCDTWRKCRRTKDLIRKFNKPLPLLDKIVPLVGNKKEIKLADIGSGPIPCIGSYLHGVELKIYSSDVRDFTQWWKERNSVPFMPVEYQDMEKLTYPDEFFDIVFCRNALDHTRNAKRAVREMIRVCKTGGWIRIICSLDQLSTGYRHYWNAKRDGIFTNNKETFDLKKYGFQIEFIDRGGKSTNSLMIATLKK